MVLADGYAHPREMETLYRIGLENYGITEEEIMQEIKSSPVFYQIPVLPEEKIEILYEMAQIAWADKKLEETERDMMRRYATIYNVVEEQIDSLVDFLLEKAEKNAVFEDVLKELNK